MTTIAVWFLLYKATYAVAQFGPFKSEEQCKAIIERLVETRWSQHGMLCVEGIAVVGGSDDDR